MQTAYAIDDFQIGARFPYEYKVAPAESAAVAIESTSSGLLAVAVVAGASREEIACAARRPIGCAWLRVAGTPRGVAALLLPADFGAPAWQIEAPVLGGASPRNAQNTLTMVLVDAEDGKIKSVASSELPRGFGAKLARFAATPSKAERQAGLAAYKAFLSRGGNAWVDGDRWHSMEDGTWDAGSHGARLAEEVA